MWVMIVCSQRLKQPAFFSSGVFFVLCYNGGSVFCLSWSRLNWLYRYFYRLLASIRSRHLNQNDEATFCLAFCGTEYLSPCCYSMHLMILLQNSAGGVWLSARHFRYANISWKELVIIIQWTSTQMPQNPVMLGWLTTWLGTLLLLVM